MHKKLTLPRKPCQACGRPFSWRKKWARDWEQVRYCSQACASGRHPAAVNATASARAKPAAPARKA